MQDVVQITDHGARALDRLATQYRGKPLLAGLIGALTPLIQQVEDMLFGLQSGLRLENAVGAQLDMIGRVLGQAREAADDTAYRVRLSARLQANVSTGSAESLYRVFAILLGGTVDLAITPFYPASFYLDAYGALDPTLVPLYVQFFADTKAGGVNGQFEYSLFEESDTFLLSADADGDDTHLGLAPDDLSTGGHLPDSEMA